MWELASRKEEVYESSLVLVTNLDRIYTTPYLFQNPAIMIPGVYLED
jgi:hypothetical protein